MPQPNVIASRELGTTERRRALLVRGAWLATVIWGLLALVFWRLDDPVWIGAASIAMAGGGVLVALRTRAEVLVAARGAFLVMAVAHGALLWLAGGPQSVWSLAFAVMVSMSALILDRLTYHLHAWLMMAIAVGVAAGKASQEGAELAQIWESTVILFAAVAALYVMGLFVIRYYDDYADRIGVNERLLRAAVHSAGVAVWEWHIETGLHYPSRDAMEMLGLDRQVMDREQTDVFLKDLLSADDFDRLDGATHHCRDTGEDQYLEVRLKHLDKWIGVYFSALKGGDGEPTHLVAALRDLTAERARDTRKSLFIATMSHELRTPLNGILGMAALMQDDTLPHHQARLVRRILSSGQHMAATISDVLDFARIEAGALTVGEADVDVRAVVHAAVALCAAQAGRDQVDLSAEVAPDVPVQVRTDAARLSQVLVNLIGNALKFTYAGYVAVTVRRVEESLVVRVEDTGMGIPSAKLKAIFDPYERVENARVRNQEGQGLGLAISRRLSRLLGGTLKCTSEVDDGSVFELRLPIKGASAAPQRIDLSGVTVLSVCWLPRTAPIIARALTHHGASVVEVDDAAAAEVALQQAQVDLVVLVEPNSTFGEARLLVERWPEHQTIVVSNRLGPEVAHCDACTGFDYPIAARPLVKLVHRLTRDDQTTAEVSAAPAIRFGDRYPLHIGVVEDDAINLMVIEGLLRREGYDVATAANGREAVSLAERGECDLLFMDLRMPVLDGIAATRAIRASGSVTVQPTIVAFTADVTQETREACEAAGVDEVLSKPAQLDDMRAAIVRAWERRSART